MTNEEYIEKHCNDDVRKLALSRIPDGVDALWCMQQIEGRQLAKKKLPRWAETKGLWFPPKLAMEQCSSEPTAQYKRAIAERLLPDKDQRTLFVDLTGGFGVDFSFLASLFERAVYVEQQPDLCRIAEHNFPLLGLNNAEGVCADCLGYTLDGLRNISLVYLDPARRDEAKRKMVALEDCSPNVVEMQDTLLDKAALVMMKLSPMLDISMALRKLGSVTELHVVSVRGECKELLLILSKSKSVPTIHCVNLETTDPEVVHPIGEDSKQQAKLCDEMGNYLYEPNASVLKAGVQDDVARSHNLLKLHNDSHLYTCNERKDSYPGRSFKVVDSCGFGKNDMRRMLSDTQQANITVRNFPATADELHKKLKLRDGGDIYLFATTLADRRHVLIKCIKAH